MLHSSRRWFKEFFLSNTGKCVHFLKHVFRCDADVVINNIFKVFDSEHTGKVVAQELLMAFSMSMKGTGYNNLSLVK